MASFDSYYDNDFDRSSSSLSPPPQHPATASTVSFPFAKTSPLVSKSRGKVLPTAASAAAATNGHNASSTKTKKQAAVVAAENNNTNHEPTKKPQLWRLREAAQAVLDERRQLDLLLDSGAKDTMLYLSGDFDVDAAMEVLRTPHHENMIGKAFKMAAKALLQAMRQTQQSSSKLAAADNDDDDDDDPYGRSKPIPHLPAVLQVRQRVLDARTAALQRSFENKEWSKKRTKPTATNNHHAAAAAAAAAHNSTVNRNKKDKRKNENARNDSAKAGLALSSNTLTTSSATAAPKFTRNTPASSAAALDHRFTNSRAILCAAGNIALKTTTDVDPADVPQKARLANLGAVVVDATVYGRRTLAVSENAVRRAKWRYQFRQEHFREARCEKEWSGRMRRITANEHSDSENDHGSDGEQEGPRRFRFMTVPNLFMQKGLWDDALWNQSRTQFHNPNLQALTESWESDTRPALQSVIKTGAGNALYYDTEWKTRHGRLADFIRHQADDPLGWGPHLIVTTQPEVALFCQEFHDWRSYLNLVQYRKTEYRAMQYAGTAAERRQLRRVWSAATGLSEDPIHVMVMSYTTFLEDYLHVCQIAWGTVILDDGASWMAASQGDPNSTLATLWDDAIWSTNDHYTGLAGTTQFNWDFELKDWREQLEDPNNAVIKDAYIGLTARHRIMTASRLWMEQRQSIDLLPVSGIVTFVAPHFASVVREEWDRNNIAKDAASMDHFRRLVAQYTVVHNPDSINSNMLELAVQALEGKLPHQDYGRETLAPVEIVEDDFVQAEKVTFSRRACLGWLGSGKSWLRYELGSADFQPILEIIKMSTKHGHYCEEVTTSSSMTTSGATGQVAGTMAYRLAVRCGRHFGSEQGLRQHVSAQHAPPGTWLCRACGSDCITSQARTHHERACGQPSSIGGPESCGTVGATPTVGQGGSKTGVGKKKSQRNPTGQNGNTAADEKDSDGSFRVPGYRGVWVNKQGKHFIKVNGKWYCGKGGDLDDAVLFDTVDDAAKKYDEIVSKSKSDGIVELNFKADGSRNIYEDSTSTTASGVGGSAANVVPLLSVINIKDLPPDVKPLLRDPRQTSRTGGNSKRHVYAYRGVCRQARKGHDRWQSQISFMGVNHYLGTFDSEWDAAAIYAWAHLILYGEEATRQAQKEGEEAAAAYEQEKRDIAAGKIPEPPPKPEKKKPVKKDPKEKGGPTKKPSKAPVSSDSTDAKREKDEVGPGKLKRKGSQRDSVTGEKKPRMMDMQAKMEREAMSAVVSKGATKAPVLGQRENLESVSDDSLRALVSKRIQAAKKSILWPTFLYPTAAIEPLRSCLPTQSTAEVTPVGSAMLVGLPADIGWSFPKFITDNGIQEDVSLVQMLAVEYDDEGMNEKFRSVMQGSVCVIGQASKRMLRQFQEIGGGNLGLGCGVGPLDCHIGGVPGTCSPFAACILYDGEVFRFSCLSDTDVVTLNGERLSKSGGDGSVLYDNDVCSVGPRVFAFVLPTYK